MSIGPPPPPIKATKVGVGLIKGYENIIVSKNVPSQFKFQRIGHKFLISSSI